MNKLQYRNPMEGQQFLYTRNNSSLKSVRSSEGLWRVNGVNTIKRSHFIMACFMALLVLSGCDGSLTNRKTYGAPPMPTIAFEGKQVTVVRGSSCWSANGSGTCIDTVSPKELLRNVEPMAATAGSKLTVNFDYAPNELGVNLWTEKGLTAQKLEQVNTISVPLTKGIYVYDVSARWIEGSSFFTFSIMVQ